MREVYARAAGQPVMRWFESSLCRHSGMPHLCPLRRQCDAVGVMGVDTLVGIREAIPQSPTSARILSQQIGELISVYAWLAATSANLLEPLLFDFFYWSELRESSFQDATVTTSHKIMCYR